jgi:hypothetical protein
MHGISVNNWCDIVTNVPAIGQLISSVSIGSQCFELSRLPFVNLTRFDDLRND